MNCYLCGSSELTELTRQLRYGEGLVAYCDRCALAMLQHEPEDLKRYYDEEYRKLHGPRVGQAADYDELFESYVDYQGPRVHLLEPYLSTGTRLLEVGCSTGQFLHNVKDLVGEAVGVDYDRGAAEYAAERVGVRTVGGELAESGLEKGSFDLVCAMQTMEHVDDPAGFASQLREYLKPGGIVYVEVPNLLDPLLSVYGNEAYRGFYFHKAHLFYFTADALTEVMARAGFRGRVEFLQDYNVLNHVHWLSANGPQPDAHAGLSTARLPLRADIAPELRAALDSWAAEADAAYRQVLEAHGVTDNLAFIGSPRPG